MGLGSITGETEGCRKGCPECRGGEFSTSDKGVGNLALTGSLNDARHLLPS